MSDHKTKAPKNILSNAQLKFFAEKTRDPINAKNNIDTASYNSDAFINDQLISESLSK